MEILKIAAHKYNHIIVSIPLGPCPQGASQGNELERHLSEWRFEEVAEILDWNVTIQDESAGDGYKIGIFIK